MIHAYEGIGLQVIPSFIIWSWYVKENKGAWRTNVNEIFSQRWGIRHLQYFRGTKYRYLSLNLVTWKPILILRLRSRGSGIFCTISLIFGRIMLRKMTVIGDEDWTCFTKWRYDGMEFPFPFGRCFGPWGPPLSTFMLVKSTEHLMWTQRSSHNLTLEIR